MGCHERSKAMNHLLSGTALAAALLIAAPVWAQTTTTKTMPSSPAPAATTAPAGAAATPAAPVATTARHKRMAVHHRVSHHAANRHAANRSYRHTYRYHASYRTRPGDIAKQLNAQELGRIGSSTAPATARAGSYGWGYDQGAGGYGQPSQTQGIPGSWQPSASSHPGPEVWGPPGSTPRMGY